MLINKKPYIKVLDSQAKLLLDYKFIGWLKSDVYPFFIYDVYLHKNQDRILFVRISSSGKGQPFIHDVPLNAYEELFLPENRIKIRGILEKHKGKS